MKIVLHGAAKEVGKSCIEIQSEGKRYLLDAGIKFVQGGIEYPKFLDKIFELDGVFLSHAHLDHSGALPMLENKKLHCPIYCTNMTWKITNFMLQDSYHLELLKHVHPAYTERDLREVEKDVRFVNYDQSYKTQDGKIKFQYLNAGHIPGSACILMEIEGKKLLYTGDINTEDTLLMVPSVVDQLQDIDILICENTYGERMHPDRKDCEDGFIKSVEEGIKGGGSVLVPVFSVGRAQEAVMLLDRLSVDCEIYLDGMARKITDEVLKSDDPYIDNKDILARMSKKVINVENPKDRDKIGKKKGVVIVTSSGMVQGGPVMTYIKYFLNNKDNYIILTGFQANGTNGRSIYDDHTFYNHHERFKVHSHVRKFDFSAHYGQDHIRNLIRKINPKHLVLVHGDLDAIEASHRYSSETIKGEVHSPNIGDEIEIK